MSIRCPRIFSAVSRINFKSAVIFSKNLKNYLFFICIHIVDFSRGMNNIIIELGFCMISELFRSEAEADSADLGLNNSEYPAQPIILNYLHPFHRAYQLQIV